MFRPLLACAAIALLTACAGTERKPYATQAAAPQAPPPAAAPVPERPFPADSVYPLLVAEFALRRRDYDTALQAYLDEAPKLRDPGISAHATHLAQYLGREQEALQAVQLWVELEPDNVEANNTLAVLLIRQGRTVEALDQFAMLARAGEDPNFPALLTGFNELQPQQQAELVQGINALAGEFPDNVSLLLTQAMIHADSDQFQQALDKLDRVFALEPDQPQAAVLEARILLATEAKDPFARIQRLLEADPDNTQLRLQYARMLAATDMLAARAQFEILSASDPRDADLLLSLALINRETGDAMEAKAYLRQLLALGQRTDEAHYYLGRIAEEDGDTKSAIYEYRQVQEGREFFVATARAATLLVDAGHIDECSAWFTELRESHPDRREELYGLEADVLLRAGKPEEALAVLNQGVAAFPDSTSLRYARAMTGEELGDLALLERDLRQLIAEDPDNATALNALGYTLADRTDRYDEAYALISRAIALQPEEPAVLDSMGWVLYRMNRPEEALPYLTRAYAAFPDPEVGAHLGEVLWVTGDTQGALDVWQGALLKGPDNAVLAETLQRLGVTQLISGRDFNSGAPPPGVRPGAE